LIRGGGIARPTHLGEQLLEVPVTMLIATMQRVQMIMSEFVFNDAINGFRMVGKHCRVKVEMTIP